MLSMCTVTKSHSQPIVVYWLAAVYLVMVLNCNEDNVKMYSQGRTVRNGDPQIRVHKGQR